MLINKATLLLSAVVVVSATSLVQAGSAKSLVQAGHVVLPTSSNTRKPTREPVNYPSARVEISPSGLAVAKLTIPIAKPYHKKPPLVGVGMAPPVETAPIGSLPRQPTPSEGLATQIGMAPTGQSTRPIGMPPIGNQTPQLKIPPTGNKNIPPLEIPPIGQPIPPLNFPKEYPREIPPSRKPTVMPLVSPTLVPTAMSIPSPSNIPSSLPTTKPTLEPTKKKKVKMCPRRKLKRKKNPPQITINTPATRKALSKKMIRKKMMRKLKKLT